MAATILGWLIKFLFPTPTGKRRVTAPATAPTPEAAPAPVRAEREELPERPETIGGDEVPMVRPYLVVHEQRREAQRQRERRRALILATMGIDYAGVVL